MAYGSELVLELDDVVLRTTLTPDELIELDTPAGPNEVDEWPDGRRSWLIGTAADRLQSRLRDAHQQVVATRFDPSAQWVDFVTGAPDLAGSRLRANTPAGVRFFAPFTIEGFGAEDDPFAVIGISLWGRYAPIWADWRHAHGGSGGPIRFDAELTEMVDVARTALADVVPAVASAPLVVVDRFY